MTQRHIRRVRTSKVSATVRTVARTTKRADMSRQVDTDNAISAVGTTAPITPPYDTASLLSVYDQSNMLRQCIQAYVTNIALTGWEIVAACADTPMDDDERMELQSFIDNPNSDESLTAIHAKMVADFEKLGYGYVEVIRDRNRRVSILRHAKASVTRPCPKNPKPVLVEYDVLRGPRTAYVRELKTFRIYAQQVGGRIVYFKEFGDPRKLHCLTGRFADENNPVPADMEATELLHFRQNSEDAYGVPRWINQLPSILGSREAEEVNLRYFEDNTVPPLLLTVSGGRLTGESFRSLTAALNSEGLGKERQNKVMLLEAVPERESLEDRGNVQLKVDKLTDARPSDGLFKDYDESNQAKVRSSFRLPPVAVGLSQDVTFATANVSAFIAETQVYAPERAMHDEIYNKKFVNHPFGLGLKTVCLRSRAPSITNPEMLIKSLTALNVMGAVTPRKAVEAANKILQIAIPQYLEKGEEGYEEWMDMPLAIALKSTTGGYTSDDPSGSGNTHDLQGTKDAATKALEEGGDVSLNQPENGQQ